INIDTGCVFGGSLTALRYPEKELVSVRSRAVYSEPAKPFLPELELPERLTAQQREDELLDIEDVLGKRLISTRLARSVTIREENAIAALEVIGRFAVNPKWLVYLPPAVSPSETSQEPGLLEHPAEAFAHYRHEGVANVICEEKHMGSRAIVIVCRDEDVARRRFGVIDEGFGICYTRTGRRFFDDPQLEQAFLERIRAATNTAGLFDELASEKAVHIDKPHSWHMEKIARLATEDDELLRATANLAVDTTDPDDEQRATSWWQELTDAGGEGMVVKPMDFVVRGRRGLAQ